MPRPSSPTTMKSKESSRKSDKSSSNDKSSSKEKVELKSKLTEQERVWVISLEDAMKEYSKSKNVDAPFGKLTDFDIVSHAILAKGKPEKAIHRLLRLQKFKQAYKVRDDSTVYEAIKIVQNFVHAHPSWLQAVGKDSVGRWVIFFELEGFLNDDATTTITTPEQRYAALYYVLHALQPDLDAVRNGTVWIGDLKNVTRNNLAISIVNGGRALCRDAYPIKVKDVPCLNPPPRFSAVSVMCRPFLSPDFFTKMVGCTPQVIQQHYPKHLLSKPLGGTQGQSGILDVLEENIHKRFETQETFKLNILR